MSETDMFGGININKKENLRISTDKPDILTTQDKKVINNFIRDFGRLIILWILNKKRLYGNAIINKINNFYPDKDKKITGSSRIYPMLHDLEDSGFIEGTWEIRGRQRIKYYEITDEGREEMLRVKNIFKYHLDDDLKNFMNEFWK